MYVYRFEIQGDEGNDTIVVISESDEQAFTDAEEIYERHHFVKPKDKLVTLLEKIRVQPKSGYYIPSIT